MRLSVHASNTCVLHFAVCSNAKGERRRCQNYFVSEWHSWNWEVKTCLFDSNKWSSSQIWPVSDSMLKAVSFSLSNELSLMYSPQSDFESFLNIGVWFKKYYKWMAHYVAVQIKCELFLKIKVTFILGELKLHHWWKNKRGDKNTAPKFVINFDINKISLKLASFCIRVSI